MNKVFILERFSYSDSDIIYVTSTLEKAREKTKELGWVIASDGLYYKADNGYCGSIKEWEVDE